MGHPRAVRLITPMLAAAIAAAASASPAAALSDRGPAPNDPRWSDQWSLSSQPGIGINLLEAWRYGKGKGVVIAVLDTGIVTHPEFGDRILPGYDFVSNPEVANDGDGRDADATDPGNWVTKEEAEGGDFGDECESGDSNWHGTHVAGIALANTGNGEGIAGIAPRAKLLPVRVIGKCGGSTSDLVDGLRWAAGLEVAGVPRNANPADVINMSLGSDQSCRPDLQAAIDEVAALNIMMVAAVGNESVDASRSAPANCLGTATVAALTYRGALASYSNFGSFTDLAAPGGDQSGLIVSSVDRGTRGSEGPGYAAYAGTSAAAPHLTGVLAIARGYDPATPSDALYEVLFANLAPFTANGAGFHCLVGLCGSGALDAGIFLAALEARPLPIVATDLPARLTQGGAVTGAITIDGSPASTTRSTSPLTCSWDGTTLSGVTRGVCALEIVQPGSAARKPLNQVLNIEIGGLTPTITSSLPERMRRGNTTRVAATSDSGGAIIYTSRTPSICSVGRKGRVTARALGTCKVRVRVTATEIHDARRITLTIVVRR